MTRPLNVAIVGAGIISDAYLKAAKDFNHINITTCADLNPDAAKAKAKTYNIQSQTLDDTFNNPNVDIILNLTIPKAHTEVNLRALNAGKHVYLEKPLALDLDEAKTVLETARASNLRIGCAPDTFFGGSHQTCRQLIDDDAIGTPTSGTAFMLSSGPESWHGAPDFYYKPGGGPLFDMGPYYLTALINLLGPIEQVIAYTTRKSPTRTCTAEATNGHIISVEVDTHIAALLKFENGSIINLIMSFDIQNHSLPPIEIHGTTGSLSVPDPNGFGGDIKLTNIHSDHPHEWQTITPTLPYLDNHRSIGLDDMANAIIHNTPHRASAELAFHVLEAMSAILKSGNENKPINLTSRCTRPQPLHPAPQPTS
ncbi:Glucose--fructose oxidoreductase precursor [Poriferisphaera corsica]|uniref:Glucose--fructose oxidoreductase n=1 Tax=Poriferisphaera corsica TaxID=2528020 RepID=A0A517YW57_9BACT|nr:Gfo/Idh/MocA family oxidoreductase [Poriferisphaera corsica]QDU34465.1 Glucose--fructose oxidoreductase precursor [Poriferisphaera corsica]